MKKTVTSLVFLFKIFTGCIYSQISGYLMLFIVLSNKRASIILYLKVNQLNNWSLIQSSKKFIRHP